MTNEQKYNVLTALVYTVVLLCACLVVGLLCFWFGPTTFACLGIFLVLWRGIYNHLKIGSDKCDS